MNTQDALCLFRGFTPQARAASITAARSVLNADGPAGSRLYHTVIVDALLDMKVGDFIEDLIRTEMRAAEKDENGIDTSEPAADRQTQTETDSIRTVLLLTNDRDRLFQIMRAIKSVSDDPQDIIFASVTETALTWSFRDYFSHLQNEHEYMKTHSPEDDPDMRPV